MTRVELDFQRIRPHRGSRDRGFEELCCQLASLEDRPADAVFYRKGVGNDAGIECLVRQASGREIGWQAKYFTALGNSQSAQLDDSIRQALKKHPRLDCYIVCIPFDLRDARVSKKAMTELERWRRWREKWITTARKFRRKLAIQLWGAHELTERLSRNDPRYAGRISFWFGEPILTPAWFMQQFASARANLGDRYTPETNIELPIRRLILGFCRDPSLINEVDEWLRKLEEQRYRAISALKRFSEKTKLDIPLADFDASLAAVTKLLASFSREPDYVFPTERVLQYARAALDKTYSCTKVIWSAKSDAYQRENNVQYAAHALQIVDQSLDNLVSELSSKRWSIVNAQSTLIFGNAGVGKSHLFCDATEHEIGQGHPAILVLGGSFVEGDPWRQILEQVDLGRMSTEEFLGALDSAAQAVGTRAVIFVDAINERHGIDVWLTRLAGFLKAVRRFPRVAVALSCRTTYLPYLVDESISLDELPRVEHVGFAGRASEAARFYLDRRGIIRMSSPNLVPEF
jgi:hypothetical protein